MKLTIFKVNKFYQKEKSCGIGNIKTRQIPVKRQGNGCIGKIKMVTPKNH